MKHFFTFVLSLSVIGLVQAQENTTLQHIAPEDATETPNYWGQTSQGVPLWGYYVGHNAYSDEEFGEKYEIPDHDHVLSIIAYFGGQGNSDQTASLKVYSVGSNGLPDEMLGSKTFTFADVATDGTTPTMLTFDDEVHVDDEFFVTLDLGDYAHDPLEGDTLVLMIGPDGSRPASDDVYGRNVIRWHSHSGPAWKDFQTENFTPWSTYFAIYPVIEGISLSVDNGFLSEDEINLFPMPCVNELNLRFNALETREVNLHLFDMNGKILRNHRVMATAGENLVQFDMSDLASGSYVVSIMAEGFRYSKIVTK
jgi:hypothetical protein